MALVLIIDDDAKLRPVMRLTLEKAGHAVQEAGSGREGIRVFRKSPADLVICDVFMPDLDGFETMRELRQLAPAVKIIAISGGSATGPMDPLPMAGFLGADRVILKPFNASALLTTVAELLESTP